jgi:hypothetical protein
VRPVPAVETGEGERLRSGGGASGHGCVPFCAFRISTPFLFTF